mmetsp:Transcript_91183/g.260902  ORF Transcript_91183/g.260902 Transcript_91183/m.260902 type:complete len:216 (-) Transcript_91183:25-672(-)
MRSASIAVTTLRKGLLVFIPVRGLVIAAVLDDISHSVAPMATPYVGHELDAPDPSEKKKEQGDERASFRQSILAQQRVDITACICGCIRCLVADRVSFADCQHGVRSILVAPILADQRVLLCALVRYIDSRQNSIHRNGEEGGDNHIQACRGIAAPVEELEQSQVPAPIRKIGEQRKTSRNTHNKPFRPTHVGNAFRVGPSRRIQLQAQELDPSS